MDKGKEELLRDRYKQEINSILCFKMCFKLTLKGEKMGEKEREVSSAPRVCVRPFPYPYRKCSVYSSTKAYSPASVFVLLIIVCFFPRLYYEK